MIMARSNAKTPSSAMPTRRNGSEINQTIGQSSNASMASGQQVTHSNNHSSSFTMTQPAPAGRRAPATAVRHSSYPFP